MADKPKVDPMAPLEHLDDLTAVVGEMQVLLYALYEYLSEQPFFDGEKFADLFLEFRGNLVAALQKRPESAASKQLKMLRAFQGPPH